MAIWLFKIASLFFLFNAFLVISKLPDALFTTKELGFYFAVGLSSLFAALMCFRKRHGFPLKVVDLLVIGYLIIVPLFHLIFLSVGLEAVVTNIIYGIAYFSMRVLTEGLQPVEMVNALAEIIVIIFCFQLLIAAAQHTGFIPSYYPFLGVTGMFFNPGPFAIFTSTLIAFVYVLWIIKLLKKEYGWLSFYTLILGIGVYFVALTLSRSAWVGLFASALFSSVVIPFLNSKHFLRKNMIFVKFCASVLFLCLIPIGLFLYQMKSESADGRGLVWSATGLMINDSWGKGVGIGNFAPKYVHYQAAFFNKSKKNIEKYGQLAGDSRYAFNDLLHTFAENGISGIILFLSIVIYLFFISIRVIRLHKTKQWAVLLVCGGIAPLIVIFVAGLTAYPMQMIPISIFFWFLLATLVSVHPPIKVYCSNSKTNLLIGISLVLFSGLCFYYFKAKLHAYLQWANEEKKEVKDITSLESLYPLLNTSSYFLFSTASAYMDQEMHANAIVYLKRAVQYSPAKEFYYALGECYEKEGDLVQAERMYVLIQEAIPNLLKPYYFVAMMHYNQGDIKTFRIKAEEALNFDPKINSEEVMNMKQELAQLLRELPEL